MSNKLTGRVFITVNGKRVDSMPGATYTAGGKARRGKASDSGVAGFTESVAIPQVDFTIPHKAGVKIKEIQAMDDVTVIFKCDSGPVYTLEHAWSSAVPTLSNGDLKCQFQSKTDREE